MTYTATVTEVAYRDSLANSNKFYRAYVLHDEDTDDARVLFNWGRQGAKGQFQVLAVTEHGIADVSYLVARATDLKLHTRHPGLKVNGAGMDMAFHVVYTFSQAIYGDGYALHKVSL